MKNRRAGTTGWMLWPSQALKLTQAGFDLYPGWRASGAGSRAGTNGGSVVTPGREMRRLLDGPRQGEGGCPTGDMGKSYLADKKKPRSEDREVAKKIGLCKGRGDSSILAVHWGVRQND